MADPEHLGILKRGVSEWNQWRQKKPSVVPNLSAANLIRAYLRSVDLRGADLRGARLSGADLGQANLGGADLSGAMLGRAFLAGADLSDVNFSGADLSRANLIGADLGRSCLRAANLSGAKLSRTNLSRTNLTGANLRWASLDEANVRSAVFAATDLSCTLGVDTVRHSGPSSIGIDTICMSGGNIPESFLKGAGVSEILIRIMRSMTRKAFACPSCFISYSRKDREFAERLYADLQRNGVRCWFVPERRAGGEAIYRQTDEASKIHDKLLLILSEFSVAGKWPTDEIRWARMREKETGEQKIFPITLIPGSELRYRERPDADPVTDLAAIVKSYQIPDFSNWKNYFSYKRAFERLLESLKSSGSTNIAGSIPAVISK